MTGSGSSGGSSGSESEMDPITQVYEALWTLLEASMAFCDAVAENNRIKFDITRYNHNQDLADLPQVQITSVASLPHIQRTSSSSTLVKRFDIQVATGSMYLEAQFNLEWIIYRALAQWYDTLTALEWAGKTYVRLARPMTVTDTVPASREEQPVGWRSIWSLEVEMVFCTADLAYPDVTD